MAEREGFEPSTHLSARTRFPVALLRPLGHLSAGSPLEQRGEKPCVKRGLTGDEVDALFCTDLDVYESAVSNAITSRVNQDELDALVSFTFNDRHVPELRRAEGDETRRTDAAGGRIEPLQWAPFDVSAPT